MKFRALKVLLSLDVVVLSKKTGSSQATPAFLSLVRFLLYISLAEDTKSQTFRITGASFVF